MFGFSRTSDGSVLYAGSGDPAEGIWRSVDRGATWQPGAKTSVFCLNADGPRLLVCSNPYTPGGYAVAESSDQGATVSTLATFDDVLGPLDCDGGSPCASTWPETRAAIAASAHAPRASPSAITERDSGDVVDAGSVAGARRSGACGCRVAGGLPDEDESRTSRISCALLALVGLGAIARGAGRRAHHWIEGVPRAAREWTTAVAQSSVQRDRGGAFSTSPDPLRS